MKGLPKFIRIAVLLFPCERVDNNGSEEEGSFGWDQLWEIRGIVSVYWEYLGDI